MLVGVVVVCAVGVGAVGEDDDDDEMVEEEGVEDEERVVEEDDALLVTLKYCDISRAPLPGALLDANTRKKMLLRDRFCVGLPSQIWLRLSVRSTESKER